MMKSVLFVFVFGFLLPNAFAEVRYYPVYNGEKDPCQLTYNYKASRHQAIPTNATIIARCSTVVRNDWRTSWKAQTVDLCLAQEGSNIHVAGYIDSSVFNLGYSIHEEGPLVKAKQWLGKSRISYDHGAKLLLFKTGELLSPRINLLASCVPR
jgi:hypothetical protein